MTRVPRVLKVRAEKLGGHTHVEVWAGPAGATYALNGRLVFDDGDVEAIERLVLDKLADRIRGGARVILGVRGIRDGADAIATDIANNVAQGLLEDLLSLVHDPAGDKRADDELAAMVDLLPDDAGPPSGWEDRLQTRWQAERKGKP